ncbi:MAG TPA: hypothetical protein VMW27_25965 [Thermoanaerobaculia bacterium]|nr:hypothetical protein [Thermoanaerobaculia bacterium]
MAERSLVAELIHEHSARYIDDEDGTVYSVRIYGEEREGGTWAGWLEFHPENPGRPVLRTGQETSQPNRDAVVYWASGLEPVYLEGAFRRAL